MPPVPKSKKSTPKSKVPDLSRVEMTQIVLPGDSNQLGTAFGGRVMQWIDIAAAVAARRHAGRIAVTASMDSLHFSAPIQQGDVVVLRAAVNRAWRSSMEIGVRVEGEHDDNQRFHAATAYLTFVSVDEEGHAVPVPALEPETADEKRRFDKAEHRRQQRLEARRVAAERAQGDE